MDPTTAPTKALGFARGEGSGLRALRWLGRALFVFALWPCWYAWFGKLTLDGEALLVGGPALLIGLSLWIGAGFRLRHPSDRLEVDRAGRGIRVWRGGWLEAEIALAQLGAHEIRAWTSGSARQGTATTWYAVRFAGLGELDVYTGLSRAECEAWVARVEAAVRGEPPVATRTTIADLLAERFDALLIRVPVASALALAALACAAASWPIVRATRDPQTEIAVLLAISFGVIALGLRLLGRPIAGIALALVAGLVWFAKPWLAPVEVEFVGAIHRLSPSAETHFYFLIPGLLLLAQALLMLLGLEPRPPASVGASAKPAPVELAPPTPKLPQPPHSPDPTDPA